MTHGTVACYVTHKCRCRECRDARAAYQRAIRKCKPNYSTRGARVSVSTVALADAISRDTRTAGQLAHDAGIQPNTLYKIRTRGTTTEYVADSIAVALGLHPGQLVTA